MRCAECDCEGGDDDCNWIKSKPALSPDQEKAISTELNHLNGYIIKRSGQGATAGAMVEAMKRMIEKMS